MTLFLASVNGPAEAEVALAGGADIVDLKDATKGALGALDPAIVRKTVASVGGRRPTSAVTGDLPMDAARLHAAAQNMIAAGVDYVKIGFTAAPQAAECVRSLAPLATRTQLVGVLFADDNPDLSLVALMAACGFKGAMLDTARKGKGRLLEAMHIAALQGFVTECRREGLIAGLAGSLEPPDIGRLLLVDPTFLGFRGALCKAGDRAAGLDSAAIKLVRDLVPFEAHQSEDEAKVDWRLLSARGYAPDGADGADTDRVFVHDLILPVSIGAYDAERGVTQRVRFNVDAEVRRLTQTAQDMRDIYSYDLIVDAIRLILSRGHVALVETLAEEIAAAVLAHPRVAAAKVRVEKLDVVEGRVGVEIARERGMPSAKVHHLFGGLPDAGATTSG